LREFFLDLRDGRALLLGLWASLQKTLNATGAAGAESMGSASGAQSLLLCVDTGPATSDCVTPSGFVQQGFFVITIATHSARDRTSLTRTSSMRAESPFTWTSSVAPRPLTAAPATTPRFSSRSTR